MIEKLNWDSEFFNLKVGKAEINTIDELAIEDVKKFDLIYIFSDNPNLRLKLVDKKITYLLENLSHTQLKSTDNIEFYKPSEEFYSDLLNLTLQSGEYSRFKLDINFVNNEYEKLYTTWIDKSISGELASDIIIKKDGSKIIGFVTLSKKCSLLADIGLIAVDKDYRGQGIAENLIFKTLATAQMNGFDKVQVSTQLDNIPANKLYQKAGFKKNSITYIYHIWTHDPIQ